MPFFEWNEDFSVNVKIFDEHHRKLVELINKLYDAMKEGKGKNIVGDILNDLEEYTKFHFKAEEELMLKNDYTGYKEQLEEHNKFVEEIKKQKESFEKGNIFISTEILNFLKKWLSHHILEVDKKYGTFFNSKGIN